MSNKMIAVVNKCLKEADTFSLFVAGSLHEDTRRLIAFKIGKQRRQNLAPDQVTRFTLIDFRVQMFGNQFDFIELPTTDTLNIVVWKFHKIIGKPAHIGWMRSKASNGVLPQAQALAPYAKEFVVA